MRYYNIGRQSLVCIVLSSASATQNLRCWRHTIFWVCPSVSESVSLCVPNVWTSYLKNQRKKFHPRLVTDVLGSIDLLIRLRDQKVKGQGHSRRRHDRRRQSVGFCLVSFIFTARRKASFANGCIMLRHIRLSVRPGGQPYRGKIWVQRGRPPVNRNIDNKNVTSTRIESRPWAFQWCATRHHRKSQY